MPERYSIKHSGACLVVGYAPDVHLDVEAALRLRPGAALLGIKFASVLFPEIEHVWTQHIEESAAIKAKSGRTVYVHARCAKDQRKRARAPKGFEMFVDYEWPDLDWVAGSSGFAGALWARHGMGFDEVIMCGLPMQDRVYTGAIADFKKPQDAASFSGALKHWQATIRNFAGKGLTAGIHSMSGFTREVLGGPA